MIWISACVHAVEIDNSAYRLEIQPAEEGIHVGLADKVLRQSWVDETYFYYAKTQGGAMYECLDSPSVKKVEDSIVITGTLAGLAVRQVFTLPANSSCLEETFVLSHTGDEPVSLADFEVGFQKRILDASGNVPADRVQDRLVAIPFRRRPDDYNDQICEFSLGTLATTQGWEYLADNSWRAPKRIPSRHRFSEGWAWRHDGYAFCIFKFNQQHLCYSVITPRTSKKGTMLRFGGSCMISDMPSALSEVAVGESVDLGITRYQTVAGSYNEALYAFRDFLDEQGCRFPADYNPPVHWNQLYNMTGAWNDRSHQYKREHIEQEAALAREYHCESLYLDPGWDTSFGSFVWGQDWLGPRQKFIADMKSEYGLKVSLHCPMPPWSSTIPMGPSSIAEWPTGALRQRQDVADEAEVASKRNGRINLALLPEAKAKVSSTLAGDEPHPAAYLNDGWYSHCRSWIAGGIPAWAQIDLGQAYRIGTVRLTSDFLVQYGGRYATQVRILTATDYHEDSENPNWTLVDRYEGQDSWGIKMFKFPAVTARWVRIQMDAGSAGEPRLDEIEIYKADPSSPEALSDIASVIRRASQPVIRIGAAMCMGSRQFLDEAEKRLCANCADGVCFLMFDGTHWNGDCRNPSHGHPIPYRYEDHIRSCVDLARRVHRKYPDVLIEMHDMLTGYHPAHKTPVYYKHGLPGSYDENWGYELMWNPLRALENGSARSLYYYNMGCNVPLYLHIALKTDNEQCIAFWWYASTCRHLGIGGTHSDPAIVEMQKQAMETYRGLEAFYKRGEFYGIDEEIHLHVLPEQGVVVNVFNLSDEPRVIGGQLAFNKLGLPDEATYGSEGEGVNVEDGVLHVEADLPGWGTAVKTLLRR